MAKNISALVAEISAVNVCQSACERILSILNNPRFSRTVGERRDLWATISHTANAQIDANQEPVDKPPRKPRKTKAAALTEVPEPDKLQDQMEAQRIKSKFPNAQENKA